LIKLYHAISGTDGNYGWYKMQLKDMIGYAELNESLRHFKEFGNTIIFLTMLESAQVCFSLQFIFK
jgi:hypothetical protein